MRQVKFGKPIILEEEKQAVMDVLNGDILVHGPKAKEFEAKFARWTHSPHAVATSSCTASLHLSYFHFEIGAGDEVIVPSQSHVATVHAVELAGATPIFVDAELSTGNIDIDQIEAKITERTKAITVVHYLGMPVDMERIMDIATRHNLKVVEDCALAIGTKFKNVHAGLWGDTGCFSFYPVKHFTTAEGGMTITKHEEVALKLQRQKAFGVDRTVSERKVPGVYDVNMLGYNYRMNEIQAAIGVVQLDRIDGFLKTRKENYAQLAGGLGEVAEISLLQTSHGDFESSFYCLAALLNEQMAEKRFEIVKFLNENGVGTSVYYPKAIPEFTYYKEKYNLPVEQYVNAKKISDTSIALSVGPHLNGEDMDYVIEQFKAAIQSVK